MIVFDLCCPDGHRFEGWFSSSADFARQQERGLLCCPQCGVADIVKAPMAPAVPAKGNQRTALARPDAQTADQPVAGGQLPPEAVKAFQKIAAMQAEALKSSEYVGGRFAEKSRAMHYGECDTRPIHGQASLAEARELHDEGIPVAPLLFPVAPPEDIN